MVETSYPYDAGAGAAVNEAQWQRMARRFLGTGVIAGSLNQLQVSADGSALSVSVTTGDAFVEGFFYRNDAALALTIATANATNPRIDTVVVRLDRTANKTNLAVVTGTAAVSPVPPTLTATDSLFELRLADVAVPAAAGVIVAGNITDRRYRTGELYLSASQLSAVLGAPTLGVVVARHPVWLLDPNVVESVAGGVDIPVGWKTVNLDVLWTKPGAGNAGDVQWTVSVEHTEDLQSLDVSGVFSTRTASTPAQNLLRRTRMTDAVPVAAGGWNSVRVQRRAADATDTFTEDAALLGVRISRAT